MNAKICTIVFFIFLGQSGCSDDPADIDLKGTWIDSESAALQFIEFTSESEGRLGFFGKEYEQFENFNYRLVSNQIAIDLESDNTGETLHEFSFDGKDKIVIGGLTVIPENPAKTYRRRTIETETKDNVITLGVNDIYFDFENGHQLEFDSVLTDSRCPEDVECVWEGFASVRFNLVVNGNDAYTFDLSTHERFRQDTLIQQVNYKLLDVLPYPQADSEVSYSDYQVKVLVE